MPARVHGVSLCVLSVNTTVFGHRYGSREDGLFVFSVNIGHSWVTGVVYTRSFTHMHTHTRTKFKSLKAMFIGNSKANHAEIKKFSADIRLLGDLNTTVN